MRRELDDGGHRFPRCATRPQSGADGGSSGSRADDVHETVASEKKARARSRELLDRVGLVGSLPDAYPHQLSGGQRQRVLIAMALACDPLLLIADEPTTAFDLMVQAQVLALLDELKQERAHVVVHNPRSLRPDVCVQDVVLPPTWSRSVVTRRAPLAT